MGADTQCPSRDTEQRSFIHDGPFVLLYGYSMIETKHEARKDNKMKEKGTGVMEVRTRAR